MNQPMSLPGEAKLIQALKTSCGACSMHQLCLPMGLEEADINRLAAAGITNGCGSGLYCPNSAVTRDQMASFIARALSLAPTTTNYFSDDNASVHEADINRVAAAGITNGCAVSLYCPTQVITREQMAAFIHRALD